ncbi:hypothetical protein GCM10008083_15130 [Ulvibacter litoralis]|nr:hypothetical protein GCM10008083_15130 [Ulvibacter litoralis]
MLVSVFSYAQHDEAYLNGLVSGFTSSLKSKNIDTYLISKRYCIGNIEIFQLGDGSLCASKSTYFEVYLFWLEGEVAKIKKIDNCGLYTTLELSNSNIMDFMGIYKNDIKQNPVKHYQFASKGSGPIQSTEIHSCSRVIEYRDGTGLEINQLYNLFDITNDAMEENINFEYNNTLNIISLDEMMSNAIEKVEDQFRRE